jgi:hypothetical protein
MTTHKNVSGDYVLTCDGGQGNFTINGSTTLTLKIYTVAETASIVDPVIGTVILVSNGDSGSPCPAVYDGANWLRIPLGAPIST